MDLFENVELLPNEVKEILINHEQKDTTYNNCKQLVVDLTKVGYTCDFGLSGEPYDLKIVK